MCGLLYQGKKAKGKKGKKGKDDGLLFIVAPNERRMRFEVGYGLEGDFPDITAKRIIADVVADWARRHQQPFRLQLTGPAGATFVGGEGGPELELDAVEFCRIVSGRGTGPGLLTQEVPF